MIKSCEGCKDGLEFAYWMEKNFGEEIYIATTIDEETCPEESDKHFVLRMVDEEGKEVVW